MQVEPVNTSYHELVQVLREFEDAPCSEFYLRGLGVHIDLPEATAYHTFKVNSLMAFSEELRLYDPSYHSYFADFPRDVIDKLKSGKMSVVGSLLYATHLSDHGLHSNSGIDRKHNVIIYQEADPVINQFTFGFQEGQILLGLGDVSAVLGLWNRFECSAMPKRETLTKERLLAGRTVPQAETVYYTLAGLYAICRQNDPESAIRKVAFGSFTHEFGEALLLVGLEMNLEVHYSDDLERLRASVNPEHRNLPKGGGKLFS